ncbi:16S rRNA processing protein RimM [bacterium]|nr:16S rRNA processing protein RimM [bacterium]
MQSAEVKRIAIGVIRKPHGVRGGLKVTLYNIDLDTLQNLEQLFVNTGNTWEQLSLKNCQGYDDFAILSFDEILDRTEADKYRDMEIYSNRDELPEPDEDQFFSEDLIGCEVRDEHDRSLGSVTEILTPGAHEVLIIIDAEGTETLVPLVKEWVTDIDLDTRCILVNSAEHI